MATTTISGTLLNFEHGGNRYDVEKLRSLVCVVEFGTVVSRVTSGVNCNLYRIDYSTVRADVALAARWRTRAVDRRHLKIGRCIIGILLIQFVHEYFTLCGETDGRIQGVAHEIARPSRVIFRGCPCWGRRPCLTSFSRRPDPYGQQRYEVACSPNLSWPQGARQRSAHLPLSRDRA